MSNYTENEKKPVYKKWWFIIISIILAFPILIFEIACIIVVPQILILELFLGIVVYYSIRNIRKEEREKEEIKKKEENLFRQGYKKVCDNLYIDEKNTKINIQGKTYGFSQILECKLIENSNTINSSYGNTKGKLKNNGKIRTKVNTVSIQTSYCNELYINITVEDFNAPNIKLDVRGKGILKKNSEKYKEVLKKANDVLSLLKIIISKNNEKYIETGTITKIEHRYITEEDVQDQIKKIAELYKDGVLTEYEYSIKKQELLEKIK